VKIVVISGSPRRTANTEIMMQYVFDYTKTKNDDVKLTRLEGEELKNF